MTIEELRKGYMNEVKYQKHMLRNLQYWFQLFLTISAIGVVLIYYYHAKTTWLWYYPFCHWRLRNVALWLWSMAR